MSITEKFRKAEQAEAEKNNPTQEGEKIEGPTLKQILANPEQNRLFGMHLRQNGAEALGERIYTNEVAPEDIAQLAEEREKFLRTMERVKSLKERMTAKNIEEIVATSPELQALSKLVGSKGIQGAVLKNLERLAFTDEENFENISAVVEEIESTEKEMKEADKIVASVCEKYGISEDEYLKALQDKDPEAVHDLLRANTGGLRNLFKREKTIDAEIEEADATEDVQRLNKELDERLKNIAEALQATVMNNGEVYEAVVSDLSGARPEQLKKEMSLSEARNIKIDEKDALAKWLKYKAQREEDGTFDEELAMDDFAGQYLNETVLKGKTGFWRNISKGAWSSFVKRFLNK